MVEGIWRDRERALENAFFMKRDEELLEQLRERASQQARKEALREASGISDERLLDELVAAGIDPEAMTAMVLVPLVVVGWADGRMEKKEREAILEAADAEGISEGTVGYRLLQQWLERPPGDELLDAWRGFADVTAQNLPPDALASFQDQVLGQARKVAQAAGGILGVGAISAAEKKVLDELEEVLSS